MIEQMVENTQIRAGLDIGNGYVKGNLNDEFICFPSVTSVNFGRDIVPVMSEKVGEFFSDGDIYNKLDLSFDSVMIENKSRRFFGERAISSGGVLEEFDVLSPLSKAEVDLAPVLVFGSIAGKFLKDYWKKNNKLPSDGVLKVDCKLVTALPIMEYKKFKGSYTEKFLKNKHYVTIHNFEKPIRLELTFKTVEVLNEGEAGGYAIIFGGNDVVKSFMDSAKRMGQNLDDVSVKDIKNAGYTIGVDIGDGTVNFAVFTNKKFNTDVSMTFNRGYSQVLFNALDRLSEEGLYFKDRKELVGFIQRTPNALTKNRYNHVKEIIAEEADLFADDVSMQVSRILAKSGGMTELIFVYGGGAYAMKDKLYQKLLKASSGSVPILYMEDARKGQFLNQQGLHMMNKMM